MHLLEDTVLNLRIRMPIVGEDNPRNFITKIAGYDKVCSIANSMTVSTGASSYCTTHDEEQGAGHYELD